MEKKAIKKDIFEGFGKSGKVIVEFYSESCRPCRTMEPIVEKLTESSPDISVAQVDVVKEPELADDFGIRRVPSFVIIKDGAEVARRHGACSFTEMEKFVSAN